MESRVRFVRTVVGAVLVALMFAIAGLAYPLWKAQRRLAERVQTLEERQTAPTDADVEEIRACYDRLERASADRAETSGRVLIDVHVHQDTATGQLLRIVDGTLIAEPITFRRVDGRWQAEPPPGLEP